MGGGKGNTRARKPSLLSGGALMRSSGPAHPAQQSFLLGIIDMSLTHMHVVVSGGALLLFL